MFYVNLASMLIDAIYSLAGVIHEFHHRHDEGNE